MRADNEPTVKNASMVALMQLMSAGGIAGMCAKTAVAPFDRLKILLQGSHKNYSHLTITAAFKRIYVAEGFSGLWKGNGAMMVRIFPYAGVQFLSYEHYRHFFDQNNPSNPVLNKFFAGSMAGITSVMMTYPLDVIRAQLAYQVTTRRYLGIIHCVKRTVAEEGFRGLYKGFFPTIYGMIPYAGFSFFTFELLQSTVRRVAKERYDYCLTTGTHAKKVSAVTDFLCGALAGIVAQSFSYPFDVVRRRMQVATLAKEEGLVATPGALGTLGALVSLFKEGGFRSIYRGLSLNYIKAPVQVAVSFTVYHILKRMIHEQSSPTTATIENTSSTAVVSSTTILPPSST
eukprot:Colp12_sorted_trinity150504_noHs@7920